MHILALRNLLHQQIARITMPNTVVTQTVNIRFYTDYPVCNFKCPYCIAGHAPPEGRGPSPWNAQRYHTIVENLCRLPFNFNIRIGVGGEFFVSKDLIAGARRLAQSDQVISVNLITNLSLSAEQYTRLLAGFPPHKVALVASFHPSEVKDRNAWITTAQTLAHSFSLATMTVAYPPLIHQLERTKDDFVAAGLIHFVQPYIGIYEGKSYPQAYSAEERAVIRRVIFSRHDHEFLLNLKRPGLCNAGSTYLFVDPLGIVRPCGGADHSKILGDLTVSPDLTRIEGPVQCPALTCQCDTENINTVIFQENYQHSLVNQHSFSYRFLEEAKTAPWLDEWRIPY